MSTIKDFLRSNSGFNHELGDIIFDIKNQVNWLLVGIGTDSKNNPTYHLLKLEFPEELLPKYHPDGLVEIDDSFIPDIQHHEFLECYPFLVDQPKFSKKVGHIDLNVEELDDLAGIPILHALPELRKFYDGREYFQ